MDMKRAGDFIAAKRREKGLTQEQFAQQINVTHQAVSKWERGESFPDVSKLSDIARLLDTSVDEIMKKLSEAEAPGSADEMIERLGDSLEVSDVFRARDELSEHVFVEAVKTLVRKYGVVALEILIDNKYKHYIPKLAEIASEAYSHGFDSFLPYARYASQDQLESILLREYSQGNQKSLWLLKLLDNEELINQIFELEVRKHGNWNSLASEVFALPGTIIAEQGAKFAKKMGLHSFQSWWQRLGIEKSAMLAAEYIRRSDYSSRAWKYVSQFFWAFEMNIILDAALESIEKSGFNSLELALPQFPESMIKLLSEKGGADYMAYKKAYEKSAREQNSTSAQSEEIMDKLDEILDAINSLEDRIDDIEL